jgi:hypothetical protein
MSLGRIRDGKTSGTFPKQGLEMMMSLCDRMVGAQHDESLSLNGADVFRVIDERVIHHRLLRLLPRSPSN